MDLDEEDPLLLFTEGSADACLGEWKNERLQVLIRCQGGRLFLESNKKELVLTEVGPYEWSVADSATPESPVYTCKVVGCGRDTRLTLEPPKHKGGHFKAVLRRVEHLGLPEAEPPAMLTDGSAQAEARPAGGAGSAPPRKDELRDDSRSVSRDSPRGGRRRGPANGRGRSRSPARRRSPPRRGGGGGGGGGGGKGDDKDEIVTTLFVSGLPGDAREEEVREDCEDVGPVERVVLMRRGSERNAFVRFASLKDAQRALDKLADGDLQVCQTRVKAELARRNTN